MRRLVPWWVLALLFVVVPIVEIYVIVQVGQVIGPWWTILLLLAAGFAGSWLVKREGGRAWRALREALAEHRMPARELADGALILIGGTLLLTPGFLSDIVGTFLILPVTRLVARAALTRIVTRKLLGADVRLAGAGPRSSQARQSPGTHDGVVRGEVVDD